MIFRRKRHKLPKFPPNIIPTFKRMCEELPEDRVAAYRTEVEAELNRICAAAKQNPIISLRLASDIAKACYLLLEHYPQFNPAQRAQAVGAIRYFALPKDGVSEEHFASGFDDDVKVMNYVLEQLGFEEGFIELE